MINLVSRDTPNAAMISRMVRWVKVPATNPDDLSSTPSIHTVEGEDNLPGFVLHKGRKGGALTCSIQKLASSVQFYIEESGREQRRPLYIII